VSIVKKPRDARTDSRRKAVRAESSGTAEDRLSSRQIKLIASISASFGLLAAVVVNWDQLFPTPPENRIEMAWTHRCRCVKGWLKPLRSDGFVVQHFELKDLDGTRRRWNLPDDFRGCHPAEYLGYAIDGHVPPALLRRLAAERPEGVGLEQINNKADHNGQVQGQGSSTEETRFELVTRDGKHRAWP